MSYFNWFLGILLLGDDPHNEVSLPKISETNILNLISNILNNKISALTRQMAITCLAKLFSRFDEPASKQKITQLIQEHKNSPNYDAQIRAVEYSILLDDNWTEFRGEILKEMPTPDPDSVDISTYDITPRELPNYLIENPLEQLV